MLIVLFILQVLSYTEGNRCPEEIENVVQTCIEESGLYNLKHTIGTVFLDGRLDTQFCRSGMDIAVTCIENILNFCQDDVEQKRMLNLLVDINKLRASFYYFCQNIHVFATNQSCLMGLYQVPVCIDKVTHQQNLHTNSSQPADVSVKGLMDSLCGLSDIITTCYTSSFTGDCYMTSQLFLRLFDGARFPYCDLPEREKRFQLLTVMNFSSSPSIYIYSPRFIVFCLACILYIIKLVT